MTTSMDAVILGAGPSGGAAAILLARAGWNVAIVERKVFPRRKVCGEYLSATNWPLFEKLGVAEEFRHLAGPPVTDVGLFSSRSMLSSRLPKPSGPTEWGRALSREHLDTFLLKKAAETGVAVYQPFSAVTMHQEGDLYHVAIESMTNREKQTLVAPVIIAAHGSWDAGTLPTQLTRDKPHPHDLFGFKAHWSNTKLADGLMPLLSFPGGYGGMVHCEEEKSSISFCLRRNVLERLRLKTPGDAATVAYEHVRQNCRGVRVTLDPATLVGPWLTTGPIRPGIRVKGDGGIFRVGNAAGEAHPVVAEGISMAMQASWLVVERLIPWKRAGADAQQLQAICDDYAQAWRSSFAPRLRASRAIAHWAMRPSVIGVTLPAIHLFPGLLSWGARLSGKATAIVG